MALFPHRWQRRRREGRGGGGGAGLPGEVFEQPGHRSAQTGAVRGGAAHQSGRPDSRAEQRQGPLQDREGEGCSAAEALHKRLLPLDLLVSEENAAALLLLSVPVVANHTPS